MDLNRLEEFTIIAKHLSIKKAAEELHISPATLSSRLNNFEKSLNTELFHRDSSHLSLSPSGHKLLTDALSITRSVKAIKDEIRHSNSTELQHLRILVVGFGLPFYLGPYLDIVSKNNPSLQLDILDDTYCPIENGLKNNLIDLAFAPTMAHTCPEGIIRHVLASAHQYVLLPEFHPLVNAPSVSLKELDGETFILYPNHATTLRSFQIENLNNAGIRYHIYESDTSANFYQLLVPIGKGVVLTPFHSFNDLPNTRSVPIRDIIYPAPSTLLYSKDHIRPEAKGFVQDFLKFVKEASSHDHRKTLRISDSIEGSKL
ncbi:MAG: LysR family transcriptional regulator [Agathobacter sp.]|nr:LysR family transcriptional regulator [Agathobacter sp.]